MVLTLLLRTFECVMKEFVDAVRLGVAAIQQLGSRTDKILRVLDGTRPMVGGLHVTSRWIEDFDVGMRAILWRVRHSALPRFSNRPALSILLDQKKIADRPHPLVGCDLGEKDASYRNPVESRAVFDVQRLTVHRMEDDDDFTRIASRDEMNLPVRETLHRCGPEPKKRDY